MMNRKNKIKRIVSVILVGLVVMSTFAGALAIKGFAVNDETASNADDEITAISELAENEMTEEEPTDSPDVVEPIKDDIPIEIPTETLTSQQSIEESPNLPAKKDKYKITFALYNVKSAKEVTMTLVRADNKEEYEIVFNEKSNFLTSAELPVGEYTVKNIKTNDKFIKVSFDIEKFQVKENDMQNYGIAASEKETNFFLKLLANNWFYLVLLAGLFLLLHKYQKNKFAE